MALVEVENLHKVYEVNRKEKGLKGAFRGLIRPQRESVHAVNDISFSIDRAEIVGFVGPNGAGKSTTIKMLAGILHPSSGRIRIDGISPQEKRMEVVKNLGVVFGQRTQLFWDLRLGESFELLKRIYQIEDVQFSANLTYLGEIMGIAKLLDVPVRQLSLGQRMRGELAAAMLHSPPVLLLDEPTIGMDIEVKSAIRHLILEISRTNQTTVLLTTHDLDDVEKMCGRLIIINKGRIIEDGKLSRLMDKITPYRYLVAECDNGIGDFSHPHAQVTERNENTTSIRFDRTKTTASELIKLLLIHHDIRDISIRDPEIEDVIRKVYNR